MTIAAALQTIRRAGTVEEFGGKLKLTLPKRQLAELQPAIEALKADKAEALARLGQLQSDELARAARVLNDGGVRIMPLQDCSAIGIWSDLDGPEIRAALRTFELDRLPIRYLDGPGIQAKYKLRTVVGEPVPMSVLDEWCGWRCTGTNLETEAPIRLISLGSPATAR